MQAAILAGGVGTRLLPATETVPKVLTEVCGRPFLAHLLDLLKENGIHEVVLCTGYLGDQVKAYAGNGSRWGLNIAYSEEGERLLGTGGALKKAGGMLEEVFFVVNGDTYLPIDYGAVEARFLDGGTMGLMVACDDPEAVGVHGNVAVDDGGMVVAYEKGSRNPALRQVEAGVLAFRREALDALPEDRPVSMEETLYPWLIERREMAAFSTGQKFYDIGTPGRLRILESFLGEAS